MDINEAVRTRHSVRNYQDKKIESAKVTKLNEIIEQCNKDGNLDIKLVLNEPNAFNEKISHYGTFIGVSNYIVIAGTGPKLEERCGYYGEHIVLEAQRLGLNTCWVGLTYSKKTVKTTLVKGNKLVAVLSLGYGITNGIPHASKTFDQVSLSKNVPDWYKKGIEYALLSPTAMNQQKFKFELLDNDKVRVSNGIGFFAKVDLGIVKYHFELGAGKKI